MTDQVTSCTVASSGVITAESSMLSLTPSRSTSVLPLTKMVMSSTYRTIFTVQLASVPFTAVAYTVTVPVVSGVSTPFASMVAVPVPFSTDQVSVRSAALSGVNVGIIRTSFPTSASPG